MPKEKKNYIQDNAVAAGCPPSPYQGQGTDTAFYAGYLEAVKREKSETRFPADEDEYLRDLRTEIEDNCESTREVLTMIDHRLGFIKTPIRQKQPSEPIPGTWLWALKQLEAGKKVRITYKDNDPMSWHDNWTGYLKMENRPGYARYIWAVSPASNYSLEGFIGETQSRWNPSLGDFQCTDWVVVDPRELQIKNARANIEANYEKLLLHLVSVHCNGAALGLTLEEAIEEHQKEHRGPGGIRHHDESIYHWEEKKVLLVLAECANQ